MATERTRRHMQELVQHILCLTIALVAATCRPSLPQVAEAAVPFWRTKLPSSSAAMEILNLPRSLRRHVVVGEVAEGVGYTWHADADYEQWQRETHVEVGDVAVFFYDSGKASVVLLPDYAAFEQCDLSRGQQLCGPKGGDVNDCLLDVTREAQFVASGLEGQCQRGQKVIIQPSAVSHARILQEEETSSSSPAEETTSITTTTTTSSSSATNSSSTPTTDSSLDSRLRTVTAAVPSATFKYVTVGYAVGALWYPWNALANYNTWTINNRNKLYAGDVAVFTYPPNRGQVYRFYRKEDFDLCRYSRATPMCLDIHGVDRKCTAKITTGDQFFATGLFGRCKKGQKVVIRGRTKQYVPRTIVVGEPKLPDYSWPWNPNVDYAGWMAKTKINIGDTLVFKYAKNRDSVYIVPTLLDYQKCDYRNFVAYCNETDGFDGCYTNALTAGTSYYISGRFGNCLKGQKIMVTPQVPVLT